MTVVGLIFSNVYDRNISEMTRKRTMASVPFGCRYRLIDFALSNMVNSGIDKVGIGCPCKQCIGHSEPSRGDYYFGS